MQLFPSDLLVRRIEQAEAQGLEAIVAACGAEAMAFPVGGGVALYRGPGSPFNKLAGLGFAPLSLAELAHVEQLFGERGEPIQVELATHAHAHLGGLLCSRGYELTGFENVLGRRVDSGLATNSAPNLTIDRAADTSAAREAWVSVLTDGFSARDAGEQVPEHDTFERNALESVFRDMADKPSVARWLASWDDEIVGGASMGARNGVAQLFGAAVLPSARRRGVHTSLLEARLAQALAQGCELAVITTQPGSRSHHNAQRAGFQLLYSRAIWRRTPVGTGDRSQ